MPPQKLASKIAELSGKIFTKNIFLLFDIISRTRLYWDFSKKSGVSLRVQPGNLDFNRTRTEMGTVKDALKVGIKI